MGDSTRVTVMPWLAWKAQARSQNPAVVSFLWSSIAECRNAWPTGFLHPIPGGPSESAMPATIGDATQLLHVDMDRVSEVFLLVTHRFGLAHATLTTCVGTTTSLPRLTGRPGPVPIEYLCRRLLSVSVDFYAETCCFAFTGAWTMIGTPAWCSNPEVTLPRTAA